MSNIDFVGARPIEGHLTHAVRYDPYMFHQPTPITVMTFMRALCGVGRGGMYVRTDDKGEIQPYKGIDGCDRCFRRVQKIRESA